MNRSILLLPLLLAACAGHPAPLPPPPDSGLTPAAKAPALVTEVRPVVSEDKLQGRWTIVTVNGEAVQGAVLELGGEGPMTTEKHADGGIIVKAPRPASHASLGCNEVHLQGWTRNGDKLMVGTELAPRTERGCDARTERLDQAAYDILRLAMTMELTPPERLRLINEKGTLDLVRQRS